MVKSFVLTRLDETIIVSIVIHIIFRLNQERIQRFYSIYLVVLIPLHFGNVSK